MCKTAEKRHLYYSGKEIFVGVHSDKKHSGGTNIEGALVVGRAFSDFPVIPIRVEGALPLKRLVSLVSSTDVIAVG